MFLSLRIYQGNFRFVEDYDNQSDFKDLQETPERSWRDS